MISGSNLGGQWVIQVNDDYLIAMLVFITVKESKMTAGHWSFFKQVGSFQTLVNVFGPFLISLMV